MNDPHAHQLGETADGQAAEGASPVTAAEDLRVEVWLRLTNGERVEVGRFGTVRDARAVADELVRRLSEEAGWPFVASRYVRPSAVVSIDVVETGTSKWVGSSERARWAGSPPSALD